MRCSIRPWVRGTVPAAKRGVAPRAAAVRHLAALLVIALLTLAGGIPTADARAADRPARQQVAPCALARTLRRGSSGADVRCLEARLVALGYSLVGPDADFGTSTDRAVRAYQRANRLAVDGIVGPITRRALGLSPQLPAPPPLVGATAPKVIETRVIGRSVQGRDIVARRMGTPGGRVVLIVGVIHGDEDKGAQITRLLRTMATPRGVDLWLLDTINPDGMALGQRGNANLVDLNRNFSHGWGYIPRSTQHRQYSGEAPADQPETVATEAFIREVQPKVVIWYHQDLDTLTINGANTAIPRTYGSYVGMSPSDVQCSQRCTGTASTFANRSSAGVTSFIVELPGSSKVDSAMVRRHAAAVLAVITL